MGDGVGDKREFIDIARRTVPCRSAGLGADEAGLAFKPHCPAHSRSLAGIEDKLHGGYIGSCGHASTWLFRPSENSLQREQTGSFF